MSNLKQNLRSVLFGSTLGLLYLGLPCLFTLVSKFSGLVVCDSVALSDSPLCNLKYSASKEDPDNKFRTFYVDLETESARYAKSCYGASTGYDSCDQFYRRSIPYTVQQNDSCPFPGDICHGGHSGAFSLDTGLVSIDAIGINTGLRHRFRRKTTCSPLRTDQTRFLQADEDSTGKISWSYSYGSLPRSIWRSCASSRTNCTWRVPINTEN